ncbi:glycosylhydrolase-like jelly roll fold domain-containing protein [Paenibacillus periandrae]|uniref:glycosylhydrolase-like jelly roll fold domain-containing protein n=1 Tax=Paenibacillus periandrae TaxID=1761741 RepID=UPI001F08D86C|nr:glycosylhydrolase-like jelly roll fold domain-containing protein [Paenibacillus periandrae]
MNRRLEEVLAGKEDNYILPFVWQKGEDESIIREELARIHDCGIRAVCIEARPHPDFLGPDWWKVMDVVMEEARQRDMKVWVLDDEHFPTGYAAGKVKDAPPELRRVYLNLKHLDMIGPQQDTSCIVEVPPFNERLPTLVPGYSYGGTLFGVIAAKRHSATGELTGETIDLWGCVQDNVLFWDVPEGQWRIFMLIETTRGASEHHFNYVNPLVAESVRILVDTVYEAFYERYRDDFGHTFAGFFSDEPGLYNDKDTFDFESKLGKKDVVLPWSRQLPNLLEEALGSDFRRKLPFLWYEGGEGTANVRYAYMNVVSKLYGENFTKQLGDWCRERNVEYIGHVLEDNNVHARLGPGAGHFFRALWGQDMSGIDIIGWQITPGFDEGFLRTRPGESDNEFYHFGLAKMASSLGHLDPKKKGRTMVELFGAYGWSEGLKLMKWLTDHVLVRGVNVFVPHAFSQKEFPDDDCPPHFYARGHNPQFRYYKELNHYTNRLSHLLSGGRHIAPAGVLYHAEAEWSGEFMYFHKPVKELLRSQIDCDVLPADILYDSAKVSDGKLLIQEESFRCLIIPYSEVLPDSLLIRLAELAGQGLPLLFIDGYPVRSIDGESDSLHRLAASNVCHVVPLNRLAAELKERGWNEITVKSEQLYLRYYHVQHADLDVYMFFNEHPLERIETEVRLPVQGRAIRYDGFSNLLTELEVQTDADGIDTAISLSPYESLVLLAGSGIDDAVVEMGTDYGAAANAVMQSKVIEGTWDISISASIDYPAFRKVGSTYALVNMGRPGQLRDFSGTFRYETVFEWSQGAGEVLLDLGRVFEIGEVWVNGVRAGVRICPPYVLEIGHLLKKGSNSLAVEVTNTLMNEQKDLVFRTIHQEPSGLLGPVQLVVMAN